MTNPPKKRRRSTAFVPRIVLTGAFLGVVPACALAACSSSSNGAPPDQVGVANIGFDTGTDAGKDVVFGVADTSFCCDTKPDDVLVVLADIGFRSDADADALDGDDDARDGG